MPAGFSTLAPAAERRCGRNPAIAACSVRMVRFHARRSKLSIQASRRYLLLRAVESDDRPRSSKLGRLAAKPTRQSARVVDSPSGHCCWSVCAGCCSRCNLDRRADLDGSCLHPQCQAVRSHPLPLHRPILSRDDCTNVCVRLQLPVREFAWLVDISLRYLAWKQAPVVRKRVGVG